jgi:hypothetical protein
MCRLFFFPPGPGSLSALFCFQVHREPLKNQYKTEVKNMLTELDPLIAVDAAQTLTFSAAATQSAGGGAGAGSGLFSLSSSGVARMTLASRKLVESWGPVRLCTKVRWIPRIKLRSRSLVHSCLSFLFRTSQVLDDRFVDQREREKRVSTSGSGPTPLAQQVASVPADVEGFSHMARDAPYDSFYVLAAVDFPADPSAVADEDAVASFGHEQVSPVACLSLLPSGVLCARAPSRTPRIGNLHHDVTPGRFVSRCWCTCGRTATARLR